MPRTKNADEDEGFSSAATFTATAKIIEKGGSLFPITGILFAVLISVASPPAAGSTGCAGYVKPLNRAESFWREAEEQQVRACITRFGAGPSGMTRDLTPLHLAAYFSGSPAVIAALLEGGADPNAKFAQGATPLHLAAQHNSDPAVIAALLEGGADPNAKSAQGFTPLHHAAQHTSDPAVIAVLLAGDADPNAKSAQGFTPLHSAAVHTSDPAVIAALLAGDADPNAKSAQGFTPLHLAAEHTSDPAVIAALLEAGADPKAKSVEGITPLHFAAQNNSDPAVIAVLLEGGADPNAKSSQGGTPLHSAAQHTSDPAVIAALLAGDADPNAKSAQGFTPLHSAAEHTNDPAVIAALLAGGADPNAKSAEGITPLHLAAEHTSDPAVIAALLEAGADPKAMSRGKTAFDLAGNNAKLRGSDAYRRLREAHDARQAAVEAPETLDLTRDDYRAIQRLLNEKGFGAGPEDGRWGSKSRSALRAFQAQGGLGQTGVPDKATRKALRFRKAAGSATRDAVGSAKDDVALHDACGVGQELEPGQGCRIPGGGEFRVESDGCVKTVPDIPGPLSLVSLGKMSFNIHQGIRSLCIRGHVVKGKFNAREDAEKSLWRIESLPEAN